jgi:cell division protein FtsA
MFDPESIVVGLEIGTSKVCAAVGEMTSQGGFKVLGLGQCRSRGVRKGEITDPQKASEDIRQAIAEAEQMADVEIRSVFLGVTGAHVRGFNNRGIHPVVSADREITQEDVDDAIRNAKAVNLPHDHSVLHTIRQDFVVDDHDGVQNPVRLFGARVEARVHVIHGQGNRLQNSIRAVQSLQLSVEQAVFTGFASALAVLGKEDKEMGALVIDFGAGVTEYALYTNSLLRHSGVLAVGGDHVSNDLAIGLKIPLGRAEQLKIEHGGVEVGPDQMGAKVSLDAEPGMPERQVNLEHLRRIQSVRIEETLELIAHDVGPLLSHARAGIYLCGGGSRTRDILPMASRIFGQPAQIGRARDVSGSVASMDHPEFAGPIGLARFGALRLGNQPPGGGWRSTFGNWFRR